MTKQNEFDLEALDTAALLELRGKIDKVVDTRKRAERSAFIHEVKTKATNLGIPIDELVNSLGKRQAVAYRHPEKHDLVWTGRGQKPKWLRAYMDAGGKLEDCRS